MNKLLAFIHCRIPYIKELNTYTGSVTATLLMQQLEYWFEKYPEGFYKFLSPCDHPRYKSGDSWTEELGISDYDFRKAFSQIGERYKSKTQYEEALAQGHDPFQGKYYLSYRDVRHNITHYIRNHAVVDHTVKSLLMDYCSEQVPPAPVLASSTGGDLSPISDNAQVFSSGTSKCGNPESGVPERSFPELEILDFRNSRISSSGNAIPASPSKEAENYSRAVLQKTTAAEQSPPETTAASQQPIAAALHSLSKNDLLILEALTAAQLQCVEALVTFSAALLTHDEPDTLANEIRYTLLSPMCFSRAQNDFVKKFHTIQKCILQGKWFPPAGLYAQEKERVDHSYQHLLLQRNTAANEYQHCCEMLQHAELKSHAPPQITYWRNEKNKAHHKQQAIDDQLACLAPRGAPLMIPADERTSC